MKRFLGSALIMDRNGYFTSAVRLVILSLAFVSAAACVTIPRSSQFMPPILAQDEIKKPYTRIGVLECTKDTFGSLDSLAPAHYDWAYGELREAAKQVGADAVMTPELRVEQNTFLLIPTSTIRAKGIAIRFR